MGRRQHYVPIFYLARFARDDGRVFVHEFGKPGKAIHPKNVAVEYDYNSVPGADDRPDPSLEPVLTEYFDTPTSAILTKVDKGEVLDPMDRLRLSVFMVFQYYRSPGRKNEILRHFTESGQAFFENLASSQQEFHSLLDEADPESTPEEREQLREFVMKGEVWVKASNLPWLEYAVDMTKRIAPILQHRGWSLCSPPKGIEFVTSDEPVKQYVFGSMNRLDDLSVWTAPNAMTVFPIDPQHCILLHRTRTFQRKPLTPVQARDLNRVMVLGSYQRVYSRRNERFIQTILSKKPGFSGMAGAA